MALKFEDLEHVGVFIRSGDDLQLAASVNNHDTRGSRVEGSDRRARQGVCQVDEVKVRNQGFSQGRECRR
jgi:hypothetical protein